MSTSARLRTIPVSCVAATTTEISDFDAPPGTIDGVLLYNNDVVLVKDQTIQVDNGFYIVNDGGSWTKSTLTIADGLVVGVKGGSTYAGTLFVAWKSGENITFSSVLDSGSPDNAHLSGTETFTGNKTFSGTLTLGGDPTAALEAATKQYVDSASADNYVDVAGDTMTGSLILDADPTAALEAATKQYVDAGDNASVQVAGDTMTGDLTLAGDPDAALKAATKQYVDAGDAAVLADASLVHISGTETVTGDKKFTGDVIATNSDDSQYLFENYINTPYDSDGGALLEFAISPPTHTKINEGIRFTTAVAGTCSKGRCYVPDASPGLPDTALKWQLWNYNTSTLLAEYDVLGDSPPGGAWYEFTLPSPVSMPAGTYLVTAYYDTTVTCGAGYLAPLLYPLYGGPIQALDARYLWDNASTVMPTAVHTSNMYGADLLWSRDAFTVSPGDLEVLGSLNPNDDLWLFRDAVGASHLNLGNPGVNADVKINFWQGGGTGKPGCAIATEGATGLNLQGTYLYFNYGFTGGAYFYCHTYYPAGYKPFYKEGAANSVMGVATLVAGTVTVNTTTVDSTNSRIFLTIQSPGGTVGTPYVSAKVNGTSFTITSTSGSDTSQVAWLIVNAY